MTIKVFAKLEIITFLVFFNIISMKGCVMMYPNKVYKGMVYPKPNPNDRFIGGGFLGPFILGGLTGGLVAPFFYGNRPNYNYYYPYPYPTTYYYGGGYYR